MGKSGPGLLASCDRHHATGTVAVAPTAPPAPTLNSATAGNAQVVLAWTANGTGGSAITGYNVLRGTVSGGETLLAGNVAGPAYTDNTAVNGTTYFYEVQAINAVGTSASSNELSATPATVPAAPTLNSATAGNAQVALAWTANGTGGSPITGYNVLRGTVSGGETLLAGNVAGPAYTDNTAVNGTTYFYEVQAINAVGTSASSNELSAKPTAPAGPTVPGAQITAGAVVGTVVNVAVPATVQDGDLMVVALVTRVGTNTWAPPDGTWTLFTGTNVNTSTTTGQLSGAAYWRFWHTGDPMSFGFTISGSATNNGGAMSLVRGANATQPDAAAGVAKSTTTNPANPGVTTTTANVMLIGFELTNSQNTDTLTPPAGFTGDAVGFSTVGSNDVGLEVCHQLQGAAGASGTATWGVVSANHVINYVIPVRSA